MSAYPIRCAAALGRTEVALFIREPIAIFFSLAFPLILLLFVGSIGGSETNDAGIRFIDAYMATMVGVTAANVGIMGMAIHIAENRGRGALKRYKISPMPAGSYFAAQFVTALVVLALSMLALTVVTASVYGFPPTANWLPFLAVSLISLYVCMSLGILLGGLPLPVRSVQVVSAAVFFLMFFSSGSALPREAFPDWLRMLSDFNPLTILNINLTNEYTGAAGHHWLPLGALVVFALILNVLSARIFDWEGRA